MAKSTARKTAKKTPEKKAAPVKKPISSMINEDMWQEELELLYGIVRATELVEETKWGGPCFTINGKNVLGLGGFKSYVGIWFHQGVFLKDPLKVLVNASEGKTKALRQWRFRSKKEIPVKQVRSYVLEAIANAKAGLELKPEKKAAIEMPQELKKALASNKKARLAFDGMTPFRQREFMEYVAEAKREETRVARAGKSLSLLEEGKGLHDKYR